MKTFAIIQQLHRAIKEARTITNREIAVAVEAGQFQVNEIEKLPNGDCNITHLTEKGDMSAAVDFLNKLVENSNQQ